MGGGRDPACLFGEFAQLSDSSLWQRPIVDPDLVNATAKPKWISAVTGLSNKQIESIIGKGNGFCQTTLERSINIKLGGNPVICECQRIPRSGFDLNTVGVGAGAGALGNIIAI